MDPDVLIVGAGPSGAVTALRLAQDGFKVTVLEQGDWPDYSKAKVAEPEFATADRDWGWDPNMRAAPGDYPIDESESDITALMWNGVGGGTVVFAAQWRNMPSDFRVKRSTAWPTTGCSRTRTSSRTTSAWNATSASPAWPATPRFRQGRVRRCRRCRSGRWVARSPGPTTSWAGTGGRRPGDRHPPLRRLNPCVQRATCLNACADGAKASVDRTHWPRALELGVELITNARVRTLTTRPDGLVKGAIYLDADGAEHEVTAPVTVLCANGIGTPACC